MLYVKDGEFIPPIRVKFFTPNRHCAWRVQTLDTKEPDTIAWLCRMKRGEVLFDVGANMGQYALIAAARGLTVHAFEPESQNFALLMRNIYLNDMGDRVTAWPICFSDDYSIDTFHVQSLQIGGSCSSFGEEVNYHLQPKKYAVHQGSVAFRMTSFCAEQKVKPDHVKIDVDGLEHKP
jgi:FkbM family methyltransferase